MEHSRNLKYHLIGALFALIIATCMLLAFSFVRGVGESMQPTMSNRNISVGFNLATKFEIGDIITFKPKTWNTEDQMTKRVVATKGDTVVVNGVNLYINGALVDDSAMAPGYAYEEYVLADDELFVLGDNRGYSVDSRAQGPIKEEDVISKILFWIDY